jgi:hypothetical protein
MFGYCSLAQAKAEHKATSTVDDDLLMRNINQISRRIDKMMNKRGLMAAFGPNNKEIKFPISQRYVNSSNNSFVLRDAPPLLAITSATIDTTSITTVLEGYPQGEPWFRKVRITSDGDQWYSYVDDDDPSYLNLTGVWGYHNDYTNAWLNVGALSAQMLAGASTFTIADIDGDDDYGFPDKISRGMLLKIDSEYMLVTATNTTTNTGTVKRAMLGTTPALHNNASTIYRWETEEPIQRVVARQAGLLYARRGAYQVETVDGVGAISYPQDLLTELKHVLAEYINS